MPGGLPGVLDQFGDRRRAGQLVQQEQAEAQKRETITRNAFDQYDRGLISFDRAMEEVSLTYRDDVEQQRVFTEELARRETSKNYRKVVPMITRLLFPELKGEELLGAQRLLQDAGPDGFKLLQEFGVQVPEVFDPDFSVEDIQSIGPGGRVKSTQRRFDKNTGEFADIPDAGTVPGEDLIPITERDVDAEGEPTRRTGLAGKRSGIVQPVGEFAPEGGGTRTTLDADGNLTIETGAAARARGTGQGQREAAFHNRVDVTKRMLSAAAPLVSRLRNGEPLLGAVGATAAVFESAVDQLRQVGQVVTTDAEFSAQLKGLSLPPDFMQAITSQAKVKTALKNLVFLTALSRREGKSTRAPTAAELKLAMESLGLGLFATPGSRTQGIAHIEEVASSAVRDLNVSSRNLFKKDYDVRAELDKAAMDVLFAGSDLMGEFSGSDSDERILQWDELTPEEQQRVIKKLGGGE